VTNVTLTVVSVELEAVTQNLGSIMIKSH